MTQQTLTRQQAAERLCDCYAVYFDITHSPAEDAPLVAEMAFHAHTSKYVLSKKHVLWEANAYDHALILRVQTLTAAMVEDWFTFLTREAEPELVHPGASCPPEGHMASTLTLILIAETVEPEAARAVRRAKFSKSYRFSLRGWATGRAAAADLGGGCVYASRDAKDLERHLLALMRAQ